MSKSENGHIMTGDVTKIRVAVYVYGFLKKRGEGRKIYPEARCKVYKTIATVVSKKTLSNR